MSSSRQRVATGVLLWEQLPVILVSRGIPLINSLFFPVDPKEGLVGLSLTAGIFFLALAVYLMISRGYNSSWLRFASSASDVTLVSSALVLFLRLNQPHTAVNSGEQ